jgi:hypothetical protein
MRKRKLLIRKKKKKRKKLKKRRKHKQIKTDGEGSPSVFCMIKVLVL